MTQDPRLEDLRRQLKAGLFTRDIAKLWRCSQATVNYWIRKDPELVRLRDRTLPARKRTTRKVSDFMLQKYVEDGWTHKRIAAFTGMHLSTIQRRMKKAPHLEVLYAETAHLRINRAKLRKSVREQHVPEIARLTCQGHTLKDIAKMRGLTKSKVTHIKREFRELFLHYMETFNVRT